MSKQQLVSAKEVEKHIRGIYATWHCCALPLRLVKKGSTSNKRILCDDCNAMIKAHMQAIAKATQ